ncbi:15694_t:CDS:1 [Funneliformis mosseae]|uniref:15694_t:CDS:1 n=1 Tax=Funneliformis mosseae TaxID=27381 RepID=A0A9N8VTW5_FUNMO|nr:15694_t:CDS:1 [Funneliformis mosseae]
MKLLPKFSKQKTIPRSQLIKYAIIICIFTILWNIIEGVVSIFFGNEGDSVSLIFFGVDSFIEVTSAGLVLWRFLTESKPDEEKAVQILEENLGKERKATMGIGLLFLLLSIATISDAIVALVQRRNPETTIAGLIISSVSLSFMGFLWLSKKYLAKKLNSSTMASEAQCSLACIKITLVLFLGSILFMIWKKGWWIDSTAAIILGILFAKEGVDMIMWARSKNFSGGCCKHDAIEKKCCEKENEKENRCSVNSATSLSNNDGKRERSGITTIVEKLTSFTKVNRASFRKSTNSVSKNTLTNQEGNQEDNQERKHDCCSDNKVCKTSRSANEVDYNETTEKYCGDDKTNQSSCCSKESKESTENKDNVKFSSGEEEKEKNIKINSLTIVETRDTIDVDENKEKDSSCACCHE